MDSTDDEDCAPCLQHMILMGYGIPAPVFRE